MIKVSFFKEGMRLTLRVSGHAGYAAAGHDIVCSACSILMYTVAEVVAREKYALASAPDINLVAGFGTVSCEVIPEKYDDICRLYEVAMTGFAILAYNYPDHVKIQSFGEALKPLI